MEKHKIQIWVYILQGLLTLILISQAVGYYQLQYDGVSNETMAEKRQLYELAGRTTAMALVYLVVMFTQNAKFLMVVFLMSIFREGQETVIDTIFETNRSVAVNILVHLVILALEIWAFIKLYFISKRQNLKVI